MVVESVTEYHFHVYVNIHVYIHTHINVYLFISIIYIFTIYIHTHIYILRGLSFGKINLDLETMVAYLASKKTLIIDSCVPDLKELAEPVIIGAF